jgi:hypothetical protein
LHRRGWDEAYMNQVPNECWIPSFLPSFETGCIVNVFLNSSCSEVMLYLLVSYTILSLVFIF